MFNPKIITAGIALAAIIDASYKNFKLIRKCDHLQQHNIKLQNVIAKQEAWSQYLAEKLDRYDIPVEDFDHIASQLISES